VSLTTLKAKLIKIGAKVVSHGRIAFQMAEVAIPRTPLPISCGWSRNCGHHRRPFRREALDCFASDQEPTERYVLMPTKSIFSALGAPMS